MVWNVGWFRANLGQSENGKDNTDCTDTQGEDGRSDLETGRTTGVTTGGVGRTGRGGSGAGGTDRGGRDRGRRGGTVGGGESAVEDRRGMGDTIGRSGDLGLVWHGGDGTQRLRGLSVGLDLAAGIGVDAGEILVVALARLEGTVLGVIGGIVKTSDAVVDVFAVAGSVGASGIADLEAEEVCTEEARTEG